MENAARLAAALGVLLVLFAGGDAAAERTSDAQLARNFAAEARVYAGQDVHGRAVCCALAAIILDEATEEEMSLLLGHQLTWQDRPKDAIPWYERRLEFAPGDREARLGYARALAWAGRDGEAAKVYRALLAEDPNDDEARLGLARLDAWAERHGSAAHQYAELVRRGAGPEAELGYAHALNARGKHRAAEAEYLKILARDPGSEEAHIGLGRALHWMGEDERALEVLQGIPRREAHELRKSIWPRALKRVEIGWAHAEDVDDQELDDYYLNLEGHVSPQFRWVAGGTFGQAEDPFTPRLDLWTARLGAAWRFSRSLALNAYLSGRDVGRNLDDAETVDVGAGETRTGDDVKSQYFNVDSWLTWNPADWTRVDFGYARVLVETPRSQARGVELDQFSIGANRRLTDIFGLRARGAYAAYTDDNTRTSAEGALEFGPWRIRPARLSFDAGASYFRFDEDTDHGYYSPEEYNSLFATVYVRSPLGGGFAFSGDLRASTEQENDADRFGVLNGGAELSWRGSAGYGVSGYYRRSTSRFDTSAGYGREGYGVALHRTL